MKATSEIKQAGFPSFVWVTLGACLYLLMLKDKRMQK